MSLLNAVKSKITLLRLSSLSSASLSFCWAFLSSSSLSALLKSISASIFFVVGGWYLGWICFNLSTASNGSRFGIPSVPVRLNWFSASRYSLVTPFCYVSRKTMVSQRMSIETNTLVSWKANPSGTVGLKDCFFWSSNSWKAL